MNVKKTINLNDFSKAKSFTGVVETFASDIDIVKGRYVIDAKSALGIFTLDLSKPVEVVIHSDNEEEIMRFNRIMEEFA